mmetsp:Transcript_115152/g.287759  ORF Transcript_115152/g.287759 Transcript_115152/m.287759 type:complete len:93 (+) Transcript_115152:2116-2394(+)
MWAPYVCQAAYAHNIFRKKRLTQAVLTTLHLSTTVVFKRTATRPLLSYRDDLMHHLSLGDTIQCCLGLARFFSNQHQGVLTKQKFVATQHLC